MNILTSADLDQQKNKVETIISDLHQITKDINHKELETTVGDLMDRITEPFMFVIVGEVKAGKSSFINALLDTGKEICKVAASPMTDTIQQILYGTPEREESVNEYLKKIYLPIDVLKEVAVVDTPGTNTIVKHHQEITERFIPASDLIVFVFESKNPYRQSSWEFFDYIQDEWRKKIVFILQQKDLMVPADLVTNLAGVKEHAIKKGISDPNIFAVSAKMELEGKHDQSGYPVLRDYIAENITGGKAPLLKLKNNISTASTINDKIFKGLVIRKEQYEADERFRTDIKESLETQKVKSSKQVDLLIENLISEYDRITRKKEDELGSGLSFFPLIKRSFKSMLSMDKGPKEWLGKMVKDFEQELNYKLKEKLNNGVVDIAESIQDMGKIIDLKIRNSETILKDNHEIFSDIAERRANVLRDLQNAFAKFLTTTENFYDESLSSESGNMAPNLAAGGGIAIVGVILATVTNGMVFDITGGILTTVGLMFAGVTVGLKKRKILSGFKSEIEKGREKLRFEVGEKLKSYIEKIKSRIDNNFNEFDTHLDKEGEKIADLESRILSVEKQLEEIDKSITVVS